MRRRRRAARSARRCCAQACAGSSETPASCRTCARRRAPTTCPCGEAAAWRTLRRPAPHDARVTYVARPRAAAACHAAPKCKRPGRQRPATLPAAVACAQRAGPTRGASAPSLSLTKSAKARQTGAGNTDGRTEKQRATQHDGGVRPSSLQQQRAHTRAEDKLLCQRRLHRQQSALAPASHTARNLCALERTTTRLRHRVASHRATRVGRVPARSTHDSQSGPAKSSEHSPRAAAEATSAPRECSPSLAASSCAESCGNARWTGSHATAHTCAVALSTAGT
jgi:hypothetical protein